MKARITLYISLDQGISVETFPAWTATTPGSLAPKSSPI
jgi:hypothetical protein